MKEIAPAKRLPNNNTTSNQYFYPFIYHFMQYNTYGTVWYKGIAFDLMVEEDRNLLRMWLVGEGIASYMLRPKQYPYTTGSDVEERYSIHQEPWTAVRHTQTRFFWYNLLDRVLPQLTDEELDTFNTERKQRLNALSAR